MICLMNVDCRFSMVFKRFNGMHTLHTDTHVKSAAYAEWIFSIYNNNKWQSEPVDPLINHIFCFSFFP